ncbi:H-NS family nucleoid-associated regulatory protein [Thauera linaloolentis]|uniref:DNA-binding histone-like nucleoid-structuring protein H-NS n=1 Tax=Thauera linaloolentis (strain DSM 12138 / JCM 21573 / CCUG 41526 / CIP 105981 / IAM 15112 / NBRC 102519 / 47Lol) TaxID=1123367 RepID=N6Y5E3_THAL4|nr:H-NS family nucleoid-associated regulatory protein [Thauera linaloolentis]ENO86800.1 DNA-binding histone-like nucleoid-structuring protein H-NS [Thauera linaloolentis 47Lol = DSM 12138]MCM8564826.1 H-NS histone family protein [Thauera linaloolentis]
MPFSLSKHTLPELESLLAEIKQEIAARENPAPAAAEPPAVVEAETEAALSATDVPTPAAEPAAAAPAPEIRYVHPASRTLTWTGEGAMPDWVTAYLAHGGSWSAMENAAEKLAASHRRHTRSTPSAHDR